MKAKEQDTLLKVYELAINEEHYFLDAHQTRIAFYSGIVTALVAGTVAGLFKAEEWYFVAMLCVGPILIFLISTIAVNGSFRMYQRYLEAVTTRAKIEQELGLTKTRWGEADSYWRFESLIPKRHIESREGHKSSEEFIKEYSTKGYHLWTISLFTWCKRLSIIGLPGIVFLAVWRFLDP
jgi:hypothetical protein